MTGLIAAHQAGPYSLLAPNIGGTILDGRQPKGMQLEELTGLMPYAWEQQHQRVACP